MRPTRIDRINEMRQLPPEYTGEWHVTIVERCPCGDPKDHQYCRFEERPGPAPVLGPDAGYDPKAGVRWIDIHLVRSPSDTKTEEQHWEELTAGCRSVGIAQ